MLICLQINAQEVYPSSNNEVDMAYDIYCADYSLYVCKTDRPSNIAGQWTAPPPRGVVSLLKKWTLVQYYESSSTLCKTGFTDHRVHRVMALSAL